MDQTEENWKVIKNLLALCSLRSSNIDLKQNHSLITLYCMVRLATWLQLSLSLVVFAKTGTMYVLSLLCGGEND